MTDPHLPQALRILARDIHCEDGIATQCIREAADEIDRLRAQPCPYVTGNVTRYCSLTPFTLTDAEREAVERACCSLGGVIDMSAECTQWDAEARETLLALLERTKPDRPQPIATGDNDRPQPIAAPRLTALQQLAELDEELGLACTEDVKK